MNILFETERLIARPWDPEADTVAAFLIYGDAKVMHFLPRGPALDLAETRVRLERYGDGRGSWALVEKATGELVGNVFLGRIPDGEDRPTEDYQVGWHLRLDRWGRGYATEAGRAALECGFTGLDLSVIYAVVDPGNQASANVALRLGMKPLGQTDRYYGETLELFRLFRTDFAGQVAASQMGGT